MCGIAGFNGSFSQELLGRMTHLLQHRGPDDGGTWFDQNAEIGLGHRRLSIIDLSANGHQPMWDITRRYAMVYNGELYNYKDLKRDLQSAGYQFFSTSDSEVLLTAFIAWGPDMLIRLNGIFAFAIYDTAERVLFMARDGFGVKPLYYAQTSKGVLFSSELKSILMEPSVPRDVDPRALQAVLTFLWNPAPHTIMAGIKKLAPGHAMLVKAGKIERLWKYYELPYDQELSGLPEKELEREFEKALELAVSRQMVSDVPVGSFLSGGLDSSAIVALARKHYDRGKLQCFTMGFKDDAYARDGMAVDLPYARKVARHLDVDLHTIWVDESMSDLFENMIYHVDEPQADLAPINVYLIAKLARENGIKVLLSGSGGDDILAGYRRHRALQYEAYWSWLPRPGRQALSGISSIFPKTVPAFRRLAKAFSHAGETPDRRLMSYFYWLPEQLSRELINPELAAGLPFVGQTFADALGVLPPETPALNRMLFLESKFFLTDHNLNYTDKMSMATGVETRVPFLDPDLVRFAAALPLDAKLRGNTTKYILKKVMEKHLPHEVIYRPKTGFGVPLRSWLRNDLKAYVEDILSEQALRRRGLFDPKAVTRLVKADRDGRIDAAFPILAILCTELWFRVFLDRTDGEALSLQKNLVLNP